MSIFSKLLGKKTAEGADETVRVGGMEDFMTLIRVYYQAVMLLSWVSVTLTFCRIWLYLNVH